MKLTEETFIRMRRMFAEGYLSINEMREQLEEGLYLDTEEEELAPELIALLHTTLHEKWVARLEEQKAWPSPTDNDRLAAAFSALEAGGILARENWTCCQTCGHGEMDDEMQKYIEEKGHKPLGYTFFHQQATEAAAEGLGFYLAYGAEAPTNEAAVQVGHQVVSTLQQHGIRAEWDGDLRRGILIRDFEWKRRLPALDSAISLG